MSTIVSLAEKRKKAAEVNGGVAQSQPGALERAATFLRKTSRKATSRGAREVLERSVIANARNAKWRHNNPDKKKAAERANRPRAYALQKARYAANPEPYRAVKRRINKASFKRLYAANPERFRQKSAIRRAKKKSSTIGNTEIITKWLAAWRRKRSVECYWCGSRFSPKRCHADHIKPLAGGGPHSIENLCIACCHCNSAKRDKPPEVWNRKLREPVLL